MAFSDPQSVTINAVANSLPRVSSGNNSGSFSKDDGVVRLSVSHQLTKASRWRRAVRLDHAKIATDPLTAANKRFSSAITIVVDMPVDGYTIVEQKQIVDALTLWCTTGSGANVTKLLGGEN